MESIAIDASDNLYLVGYTASYDFPVQKPIYYQIKGWEDGFITKFNDSLNKIQYSTFLGGSKTDIINDIAIENGYVYVTGKTNSVDFPCSQDCFQKDNQGLFDGFFAKISKDGNSAVYASYLGGSKDDEGKSIVVSSGYATIAGEQSLSYSPV